MSPEAMRDALNSPKIITPRLELARLYPRDAEEFYRYRSHPDVLRYQSWAPESTDDARRFIADLESVDFDIPDRWFQLAVRLRETGNLVGDLGVRSPAGRPRQSEVGFTIVPSQQRQGFGTEALTALLTHLFGPLKRHRIFASVDPRNAGSIALLNNVGMRQEAHFRKSLQIRGEWVDDMVFGILASEWNR